MGKSEIIVLTTRPHWITIVGALLINGFLVLLLLGIGVLSSMFLGPFAWIGLAVVGIIALAPLWRLVSDWLHWLNDLYVVTNRRIIQAEGIINKHVIDSSLEKINDVVLTQSALGRMLGYGDLQILTGSEIGVNLLRRIAEPVRFKTEMLNQKEAMGQMSAFETKTQRALAAAPPTAGDIPELIAELDELRKKGLITDAEFQDKKTKLLSQI